MFGVIRSKKDDIYALERDIRTTFDENIIQFFKEKGFNFEKQKVTNYGFPETTTNYVLENKGQPNFAHLFSGRKNDEYSYRAPSFKILSWSMNVKFEWWKSGNQSMTSAYWHPDEMSLEEFYEKKLKRTFKLIKK